MLGNSGNQPIILQPCAMIKGPAEVPAGFGDKVTLNQDGSVLVVEAEWNDGASSSIHVATRTSRCAYGAWHRVLEPSMLAKYKPRPEFGTSVQVTHDGQLLLATIEDVSVELQAPTKLPLAFLFRKAGPAFQQLGEPLVVDVAVGEPEALRHAHPGSKLSVDTSRGLISGDGSAVVITTQLSVQGPQGGSSGTDVSIPGKVYVFRRSSAGFFHDYQVIQAPLGQTCNATFGKNAVLSASGNWLALSEDANATVYVYGRARVSDKFGLVATLADLFETKGGAEVEEMTLSPDGSYLVVAWKMPETKAGAGAFAVYWRVPAWHAVNGSGSSDAAFQRIYNISTGVVGLDGMRMATVGKYLRLVLGFAGEQAQIYDIDTMAVHRSTVCRSLQPSYVIPAKHNGVSLNNLWDPENLDTVFEGVDISGDGLTVVLGAEARNGVYAFDLPAPGPPVTQSGYLTASTWPVRRN